MSSKPRSKRASLSDTSLTSDMKIWRRNKMEDRKLAIQNDMMDKHKAYRRKSYHQAQASVHKDFDEKFSKKTPSADEYLEKSQAKYSTWKERERERLDRKYRSLYKSYMNEYNKLGIKHYTADIRKQFSKPGTPVDSADGKDGATFEKDEQMTEEEALLALEKLNLDISRRRFSEVSGSTAHPSSKRRGSTGSINLTEFTKLRSLHLALTSVEEDEQNSDGSDVSDEPEADDKLDDLNDITTRRKSVTIKEDPVEEIEAKDLIFKPKRRASIAAIPKLPVKDNPIPQGKRFDRRPTLPNIAIAFNYGN